MRGRPGLALARRVQWLAIAEVRKLNARPLTTQWTPSLLRFVDERGHSGTFALPSTSSHPALYGRKQPHLPISPRLHFVTLWAKPTPTTHFAHTWRICRSHQVNVLWAKTATSIDFAQTPLRNFMGETDPDHPFRHTWRICRTRTNRTHINSARGDRRVLRAFPPSGRAGHR